MNITTPINGLDNFMVVEAGETTHNVMFKASKRGSSIRKPGAQEAIFSALNLDFIVSAKDADDARDLISAVWS